uniref:Uncharacterized protein n=1 Tax=Nelumbo nucifera TaxID=4432 RepID=A0A822ZRU2_NELNU|nr:TPA_asm: hypothetical protein HUJ06_017534 [Nelumbo nucifera]
MDISGSKKWSAGLAMRPFFINITNLEALEVIQDEERYLILKHYHVTLYGMHNLVHSKYRIILGIAKFLEPLSGASKDLKYETPIQHHHLNKFVVVERDHPIIIGTSHILKLPNGFQLRLHILIGTLEDMVEISPLVKFHLPEASPAMVIRPQGDYMGKIGFIFSLPERLGHLMTNA